MGPWPCNPSSTFSNPDPAFLFKVLTPNTWFRDSDILCSPWLLGFGLHPTPLHPRTSQHLSSPQGFAFHLASPSLFIFTGSFTVHNPTHLYSLLFFYNLLPWDQAHFSSKVLGRGGRLLLSLLSRTHHQLSLGMLLSSARPGRRFRAASIDCSHPEGRAGPSSVYPAQCLVLLAQSPHVRGMTLDNWMPFFLL